MNGSKGTGGALVLAGAPRNRGRSRSSTQTRRACLQRTATRPKDEMQERMGIKTTSLEMAQQMSLTDLIALERKEQLTLEEHRLKAELLAAVTLD